MDAVVLKDDKPVLELSAEEFIFPIKVNERHKPLLFHMKRYRSYSVKSFYDALIPVRRTLSRGEVLVEMQEYQDKIRQFIESHFVRLEGAAVGDAEPTIENQRLWLGSLRDDGLLRIFTQGYDSISPPDFAETNGHRPLQLFGPEEHEVDAQWMLHQGGIDHLVIVKHTMSRLTKIDHDKYKKAFRRIEKNRETYTQANWDVIEQFYDHKAKSLENALIDGKPCNESNSKEWIPLVPFCMKIFVMGQIAQELETKNA